MVNDDLCNVIVGIWNGVKVRGIGVCEKLVGVIKFVESCNEI